MIKCILAMSGKSLNGELTDYFNMNISMPTVSAFVQQRDKINYCTFEKLFHSFTNAIDEQNLYKGFRLLAVDGSDLHVPSNRKETESFIKIPRDTNHLIYFILMFYMTLEEISILMLLFSP